MDSVVMYGQEHGKNLVKIGKRLIENQNLLSLLINTDLDPLNPDKHVPIDGLTLLNKNIKFIPLLSSEEQSVTSKVVLYFDTAEVNEVNLDNENVSLLVNVYCPFSEWLIAGDSLRPFAIMSEIRKSIQDRKINGLGEIKYLGFDLSSLTEEMGCYTMRFMINAFS